MSLKRHSEIKLTSKIYTEETQLAEPVIEPWLDVPFPDFDHEPVFAEN